jgi:formylmethanofuran dehydrogenase subunit E-like metal-binding protein
MVVPVTSGHLLVNYIFHIYCMYQVESYTWADVDILAVNDAGRILLHIVCENGGLGPALYSVTGSHVPPAYR